MVARVWWAFLVSDGSVATLFRCSGKRLRDFLANLFRKLYVIFHHNRPNFLGDTVKNILVSFSPTHCTICLFNRFVKNLLTITQIHLLSYSKFSAGLHLWVQNGYCFLLDTVCILVFCFYTSGYQIRHLFVVHFGSLLWLVEPMSDSYKMCKAKVRKWQFNIQNMSLGT